MFQEKKSFFISLMWHEYKKLKPNTSNYHHFNSPIKALYNKGSGQRKLRSFKAKMRSQEDTGDICMSDTFLSTGRALNLNRSPLQSSSVVLSTLVGENGENIRKFMQKNASVLVTSQVPVQLKAEMYL
jgi:hypothetical protein